MKFQKLIFPIVGLFLFAHAIITFSSFSLHAPANYTGSPSDGRNCSGCHSSSGVTQIDNVISTNIPQDGYTPGETYSITVSGINEEKIKRYGFSVTAEDNSNINTGTFIAGDSTGVNQNYVGHSPASTNPNPIWNFEWTAPAAGTGEVTFYGAFVLAKDTNAFINHYKVKTTNTSIQEKATTSITSKQKNNLNVFFAQNKLILANSSNIQIRKISVYNSMGRLVLNSTDLSNINVSGLKRGVYFVNIHTPENIVSVKVIK